ncbi:hypothetical protein M378DRAFT_435719 [Amanita muscaria Koide BX008]|uniref:Uncharacterized protein n=1 Tax=Amanita muscaria (strain Koide BX008) TaxID=946122 RepID=A0A0C2W6V3_AMAMK|nr:hypothetical protein M378DRAFT_435719 [Amanita muscaria Koide BX008]
MWMRGRGQEMSSSVRSHRKLSPPILIGDDAERKYEARATRCSRHSVSESVGEGPGTTVHLAVGAFRWCLGTC